MATSRYSWPPRPRRLSKQESTIEDLTELELTKLASEVDPNDYLVLGLKLNFSKAKLSQFKHDNPANIKGAMSSMLIQWRCDQSGPPSEIRKELADAFNFVERTDLAESISKGSVQRTPPQILCSRHPFEIATFFCSSCNQTACGNNCVTHIHKQHDYVDLAKHQTELKTRYAKKQEDIKVFCSKVQKLKKKHKKLSSEALVEQLRKEIDQSCIEAMNNMHDEKTRLLDQLEVIKSTHSDEIMDKVLSKLAGYSSLLTRENALNDYYDNFEMYERAMKTIDELDPSSTCSVLSTIGDLRVKYVPKIAVSLGYLNEATGWYQAKKIDLSEDKAGEMNACSSLSERRLVVGYSDGGVDVIGIDDGKQERMYRDLDVLSLCQLRSGNLLVCDRKNMRTLHECTLSGKSPKTTPVARLGESVEHRYVTTDSQDNIYVGFAKGKKIKIYDKSYCFLKMVQSDIEPWLVSVLKKGNIAVSHSEYIGIKDAVLVMTQDGKVLCRIPGRNGRAPYMTVDQQDQIYVAMKDKFGMVDIEKYSAQGKLLEVVTKKLQTTSQPRAWMQLTCISPSELVVCDIESLYVLKRRSTLSEISAICGEETIEK